MADSLKEMYTQLEEADRQGDIQKARQIAANITHFEASGQTDPMDAGDVAAEGLSKAASWFKGTEGHDFSVKRAAVKSGSGSVTGAIAGAILPTALEKVGKVVRKIPLPYGAGKIVGTGMEVAGEVMKQIPLKERVIGGAGGGAAAGVSDETLDSFGASPFVKFVGQIGAGGAGQAITSSLSKRFIANEASSLLTDAANSAYGDAPGALRALRGMTQPSKPVNAEAAALMQKKAFGEKTEGYIDGLIKSDERRATQQALTKADPNLKAMATQKMAQGPQQVKDLSASTLYREKMFDTVTNAVKQGKNFSDTLEFGQFQQQLSDLVKLGKVPGKEAQDMLRVLKLDKTGSGRIKERYAERVDDFIRKFGKPAEGGPASGYQAVTAETSKEVRSKLQQAYNGYLQKIGAGPLEQQYRNAYSQEMIAEAKDKLPYFLQKGLGTTGEFNKLIRSLKRDPAATNVVQSALAQHIANTPPEAILSEFTRLRSSLVTSEIVTPTDLAAMHKSATLVQNTFDKGLRHSYDQKFKQLLLMAIGRQAGVKAGGAAYGQDAPQE